MAAAKLELEGIDSRVIEHAVLEGITARGATVFVEAENFGRAAQLLATTPARRCLLVRPVAPAGPPAHTSPAPRSGFVVRLLSRLCGGAGAAERRAPGAPPPPAPGRSS